MRISTPLPPPHHGDLKVLQLEVLHAESRRRLRVVPFAVAVAAQRGALARDGHLRHPPRVCELAAHVSDADREVGNGQVAHGHPKPRVAMAVARWVTKRQILPHDGHEVIDRAEDVADVQRAARRRLERACVHGRDERGGGGVLRARGEARQHSQEDQEEGDPVTRHVESRTTRRI